MQFLVVPVLVFCEITWVVRELMVDGDFWGGAELSQSMICGTLTWHGLIVLISL